MNQLVRSLRTLLVVFALVIAASGSDIYAQKSRPTFRGSGVSRPSSSSPARSAPAPSRSTPRATPSAPPSRSTPSKPTFTGSGERRSPSTSSSASNSTAQQGKPTIDAEAARAQSQASSAQKYAEYKRSQGQEAKPFDPSLASSRQERASRAYQNRQPNSYYVPRSQTTIIYRDPYDDQFLRYASTIWLYNHWNSVDHSRFDNQRLAELETKMHDMEARGQKRDPNYTDPGVDSDLAYNPNSGAYAVSSGSHWFLWTMVLAGVFGGGVWLIFFHRFS